MLQMIFYHVSSIVHVFCIILHVPDICHTWITLPTSESNICNMIKFDRFYPSKSVDR
jgi:hypothetical protein